MLEFYTHIYPVARKEHKCEFCRQIIPKGKRYSCETGKYDGDMFTRKLCSECSNILQDFCQENGYDEFDWWEVSDWLQEAYCQDCQNREECEIVPEQCNAIKKNYSNEIAKEMYETMNEN